MIDRELRNALLASAFLVFVAGFILGHFAGYGGALHIDTCRVEDACYPEYENGEWRIVPGERPRPTFEQQILPN